MGAKIHPPNGAGVGRLLLRRGDVIFNTFGARMHLNDGRVVSNSILQALRHDPITLYRDGSQSLN